MKQEPMLGLLSLLAHGKSLGQTTEAVAEATFLGLEQTSTINPNFKLTCLDLIHPFLPEAIMQKLTEYQFQTPGIQKAYDKARNEGLREGLREGKLEGLREGELKGLREGELKGLSQGLREGELKGAVEGQRRTLVRQIERKFAAQLSAEQLERIQNATSAQLDVLTERILEAHSLEELFEEINNEPGLR